MLPYTSHDERSSHISSEMQTWSPHLCPCPSALGSASDLRPSCAASASGLFSSVSGARTESSLLGVFQLGITTGHTGMTKLVLIYYIDDLHEPCLSLILAVFRPFHGFGLDYVRCCRQVGRKRSSVLGLEKCRITCCAGGG
jgi:hypothetical protein